MRVRFFLSVLVSTLIAGCVGMPTAESLTPPTELLQQSSLCLAAEKEKSEKQKPAQTYTFSNEEKALTAKAIDGIVSVSTAFAAANQQGTHQCFAAVTQWMKERGASERQVVALYQSIAHDAGVALQVGAVGWSIKQVTGGIGAGTSVVGREGSTVNVNQTTQKVSNKLGNVGGDANMGSTYGTQKPVDPLIVRPEVVAPEIVPPTIVEVPAAP